MEDSNSSSALGALAQSFAVSVLAFKSTIDHWLAMGAQAPKDKTPTIQSLLDCMEYVEEQYENIFDTIQAAMLIRENLQQLLRPPLPTPTNKRPASRRTSSNEATPPKRQRARSGSSKIANSSATSPASPAPTTAATASSPTTPTAAPTPTTTTPASATNTTTPAAPAPPYSTGNSTAVSNSTGLQTEFIDPSRNGTKSSATTGLGKTRPLIAVYTPSAEAFKLASIYPEVRETIEEGLPPSMLRTLYAALNASKGLRNKNLLSNNKVLVYCAASQVLDRTRSSAGKGYRRCEACERKGRSCFYFYHPYYAWLMFSEDPSENSAGLAFQPLAPRIGELVREREESL